LRAPQVGPHLQANHGVVGHELFGLLAA
jgi:hypothetical protein